MTTHHRRHRNAAFLSAAALLLALAVAEDQAPKPEGVRTYQKDHPLEITHNGKKVAITQKRWFLENDHVRVALTDDPGGTVVEFVNKATGTNHVAGEVYAATIEGQTVKKTGWGWKDYCRDNDYDPWEKWLLYQKFEVEFQDAENGAKAIKVTGRTAEQQLERWHTLGPQSGEMRVKVKQTNTSDKPRKLWIRWHPYSFVSSDVYGDSACVLSPGPADQVRRVRVGWGWDHWLRTHKNYWLGADWRSGEGLFVTFEPEKAPYHFTWTDYKGRSPLKGSVTIETLPVVEVKNPGESVETRFTFFPFAKETKPEAFPLGLVSGKDDQAQARRFLRNVTSPVHLELMNRYTFATTIQFDWHHRRRDLLGVRDWGFADCAAILFPLQSVPMRVRMVGGAFDEATAEKALANGFQLSFTITVTNEDGHQVYSGSQAFELSPGIPAKNYFDREVPVPMTGIPDGKYTVRVEAIDPLTRKPFHQHEMSCVVFGRRMEAEAAQGEDRFKEEERERPFVAALAKIDDVKVQDGKVTIPIGVEDGSATVRKAFPVRLGVPFPMAAFPADAPARLLSPDGTPVPVHCSVMNVWPDKFLKWLLVDFQADCPADGFVFYKLEVGKGVTAAAAGEPLAKESPETVEINTGPMLIRIDRKKVSVPGEVFVDLNRDGKFGEGEQVVLPAQPSDVWWTGENGRQYAMQPGGEAIFDNKPGVEIESNGPLSAVVKVSGWYLDKDQKHAAFGEVRIEAFRGKPFLKIWHRVTFTGQPWYDRLASYGLRVRIAPNLYSKTVYAVDGKGIEPPPGPSALYQKHDSRVELTQAGKVVAKGERASGAVRLSGAAGSMLFYHRNLWQMYPKKLEVDPAQGSLAIHYWPQEAGLADFGPYEEYWIPSSSDASACGTGLSQEQEIVMDFSPDVAPEAAEAVFDEPVIACSPPQWVHDTNVLLNVHPYDRAKHPEVEEFLSLAIGFYERNRDFYRWYGHWDYGTIHNVFEVPTYQWLTIGRYANIGNEEGIVQAPWLLYFRSGDRRYFKFATLWTRHLMGPQSIRWHYAYPEFAGMSRRHHYTVWLGAGDWGHTMLCPWLEYYHATGYYPAWDMALRTARSMANTYTGAWRYIINPLVGNARMYLETGDEKYKAVADRIWKDLCYPDRNQWLEGSHGSRMAQWYSQINEDCKKLWIEWATEGRETGGKKVEEFQLPDSCGALGDMLGDDSFALKCRTRFDGDRATYTGQTYGTNPAYRGMVPTITQYIMGYVRCLPHAAGQIARSWEIFPARFLNIAQIKEIVLKEDTDASFTVWMSASDASRIPLTGPDGKPADIQVGPLIGQTKGGKGMMAGLVKVEVKADGKTGFYRLPTWGVQYLGSSLKQVAIRCGSRLNTPAGVPLYVRSKDLGGVNSRVFLSGSPSSSLEVMTLDGKALFSKTYYRPAQDAVAIEHRFELPPDAILRLRDKVGVWFPDLQEIPLFLNPDGVFDLP